MCEGSASIAVDCDVVEGACGGREVLPVGLLTRPRSDRGRSCERVNAHANLPRTVPKSYWSWPVAICKGSVPTRTVVSPNTSGVHMPRHLYACPIKTKVSD